jgi:DNA-binding transcriptional ArsR family regulator
MEMEPFEIFKVLSVETRIKIIELLKARGPMGAKDISIAIGITTAAVSQHLKILKQAGLVRSERKGYWIPYSIDEKAMENCRRLLTEICTCGCKGTGSFKESEQERSNVESLKKYAQELRNELNIVQERLEELESTEK